jgi:hypothetical protein
MGKELIRALHKLQTLHHLLGQPHSLAEIKIIFEFEIDVVVAASDCPAHSAEDLIERVNGQSCAEVAARD